MSRDVVTASPGDTVFDTAKQMAEAGVSCLVVMDANRVVGILSERDVLRVVTGPPVDLHRITVAQVMSSPVHSVVPALSILAAGRIMEARQIRRLTVQEGRQLVGIVTQADITRGLVTLIPLRSISDIMTRNVATVDVEATAAEAAHVMAAKRISCVVVMRGSEPAGIVTEKDMIRRIVTAMKDPAKVCVTDVMSSPVTTIPVDYSVLGVSKKMDALHLHRLVAMEAGGVCGIVTQTDIMRAVRSELERIDQERWGWMTELSMQVQATVDSLGKLQNILSKLGGPLTAPPEPSSAKPEILDPPGR